MVRLSLVKDNKFLRVDSLINGTSPYKTKTLESSEIESNDYLTASAVPIGFFCSIMFRIQLKLSVSLIIDSFSCPTTKEVSSVMLATVS